MSFSAHGTGLFYLPEFGVRSEIDVHMSLDGPVVTGDVQQGVVVIETA